MRKKEIPEVVIRSVMSLYEGAETWVKVDSELSNELEVMHQGSVLLPFLLALVVDVAEIAGDGALSELMYAEDLVLTSETIEGLSNKLLKWKETLERKGLKVNLRKTKVMVFSGITKDGMSKNKVDPCGVCRLRVKVNSVLCLQCGKWIHGRCAGVKWVTPVFKKLNMQKM